MTASLIGNLPLLTGAPNSVQKLRGLILDLAVRGKLVPQDPNDEPASELLKRISDEKQRLYADRGVKKAKQIANVSEDLLVRPLPPGWVWVRNGSLFSLRKGKVPRDLSDDVAEIPYLDIEALDRGKIRRYTSDRSCPQSTDQDILVVCDGSRSGLVLDGKVGAVGSTLSIIETPASVQGFVRMIFAQSYERLNSTMKGAAIPHLDTASLLQQVVGFPPLSEQHRIVAKVYELMALCGRLEAQQADAESAHAQLVATLLDSLTQASDADDFAASWQRLSAHFHTLFTTESSIDALKQALLQLAVMGKLVRQDARDEPALDLLLRIKTQRERLEDRKQNGSVDISEVEKPFKLPRQWAWTTLPAIGELARGRSKHRPRNDPALYLGGTIPLVQTGDVARADGVVTSYTALYNELGLEQSRLWSAGTMCITIAANIADTAILGFDACFPDSVVGFVPALPELDVRYFDFYLRTAKAHLEAFAPSTAQKNINLEILGLLAVPVPPSNEVHRIVAKVDQLMALCNQLKFRLSQSRHLNEQLATALVQRAVA